MDTATSFPNGGATSCGYWTEFLLSGGGWLCHVYLVAGGQEVEVAVSLGSLSFSTEPLAAVAAKWVDLEDLMQACFAFTLGGGAQRGVFPLFLSHSLSL